MFTLQNTGQKLPELHGRNIEVMESNAPIAKFDLSLTLCRSGRGFITYFCL